MHTVPQSFKFGNAPNRRNFVSSTFWKLFFLGFFLMLTGVVVLFFAAGLQGGVSASGALIIYVGPIPIILGAGPNVFFALVLATILTIVGFVVLFLLRRTKA